MNDIGIENRANTSHNKYTHRRGATYRLPALAYVSIIGLGSVGREILCFLPPAFELTLALASEGPGCTFDADALRLNHFDGLVKNCVKPDEGDAERGCPAEGYELGAKES